MPFWVNDDTLTLASWVTWWLNIHYSNLAGKSRGQLLFGQLSIPNRYFSGLHSTHSRNQLCSRQFRAGTHAPLCLPANGSISNCLNFSQSCILKKLSPALPPALPFFFFLQIPKSLLPLFQTISNRCAYNQSKSLLIVEKCTKVNPYMYNFMKGKFHLLRAFCK